MNAITLTTPLAESARVAQVRGLFDLPSATHSTLRLRADLPLDERPWNVGLVVGPSGCGKSTLARHLWPAAPLQDAVLERLRVKPQASVVDAFPDALGIADIAELLSSVGFASPPAWLRPYAVLSTGQQFRVLLALLLAQGAPLVVCDEFTSVVDRTVAQVASAALAKTVRRRGQRFVAVTCHDDVEAWLQPDWVYQPAEERFTWRSLRRRPSIAIDVVRCAASAWPLFTPHHYLSHALAPSAVCFLASWRERPAAFSAWLPFVGRARTRREHRTVTLPDYQGVGIGNALSAFVASLWKGLGYRAVSTTTHPAMIAARCRGGLWRMTRRPSFATSGDRVRHATTRLTAGFEYVGPAAATRGPLAPGLTMPRLTVELLNDLCQRLKAGAFERAAVESLGVRWTTYQQWLRRGRQRGARPLYRQLAEGVVQAQAHARLLAEMELRRDDVKTWLLAGPGRTAGWGKDAPEAKTNEEVLDWIPALLEALAAFPEARAAAAEALGRRAKP